MSDRSTRFRLLETRYSKGLRASRLSEIYRNAIQYTIRGLLTKPRVGTLICHSMERDIFERKSFGRPIARPLAIQR